MSCGVTGSFGSGGWGETKEAVQDRIDMRGSELCLLVDAAVSADCFGL
jgi:hypothetical protein